MVKNVDLEEKSIKQEIKYVSFAITAVNLAIVILEVYRLSTEKCINEDTRHGSLYEHRSYHIISYYSRQPFCYRGITFLFLAAPILTGVLGIIASINLILDEQEQENMIRKHLDCKFSVFCMVIMMVVEGTVFNSNYYSSEYQPFPSDRWGGTFSSLKIYAAAGSLAFLNFALLATLSTYVYFFQRIKSKKINTAQCLRVLYKGKEKITLQLLACALLTFSTILFGLDMVMNVTPRCEYLRYISTLDYCTDYVFVFRQGVICSIVGVSVAYYVVFAAVRNFTLAKARFLSRMSIFGAVCMFLLTALSSLNANDMGTRKTKNVGLNSDYSEQEQVGRPGLRKATDTSEYMEKFNTCMATAVFAALSFIVMIWISCIANKLGERLSSSPSDVEIAKSVEEKPKESCQVDG